MSVVRVASVIRIRKFLIEQMRQVARATFFVHLGIIVFVLFALSLSPPCNDKCYTLFIYL